MRLFSASAAALALCAGFDPAFAASPPGAVARELNGRLVQMSDGRLAPARLRAGSRYVAFYFGASWCAPCRAFMPELKREYERWRVAGAPIEIVFVSDDGGCRQMADYVRSARMRWPAIACRDRARMTWLQRARGPALPGILVYDAAGRLVVTSWSRGGSSTPRRALRALRELPGR